MQYLLLYVLTLFPEFLFSAQAGYVGQIPELTRNNYTA
jgi:hypothetical protein